MKYIIVLHDAFANPTQYWYPQINSLAPAGYSVITPELPRGAEQGMEHWLSALDHYSNSNFLNADTIIITHGISSLLALRWSVQLSQPIRNLISIAGCAEAPAHQAIAPVAESFLTTPIAWEGIKGKFPTTTHVWNEKDPFVSPELSKRFAELLPGKNFPLNGVGHFTDITETSLFDALKQLFNKIADEDHQKELAEKAKEIQEHKEKIAAAANPTLVTYDTAVAQSVAGYQGKVISELLAEARVKEEEKKEVSVKNPKNISYILGATVMTLLGLGLIIYGLIPKIPARITPQKSAIEKYQPNLLHVEDVQPLELSGKEIYIIQGDLKNIASKEIAGKSFSAIIPTRGGLPTSLTQFAESASLKFPVGFTGKADDFVYGYYKPLDGEKTPFLLIQFDGYDIMYSTMRNWESDMANDTIPLFNPETKQESTLVKAENADFIDQLIKNIPMRVGKTPSEKTITYGFLTDHTLLITTDPSVGEPVLRRMIGR